MVGTISISEVGLQYIINFVCFTNFYGIIGECNELIKTLLINSKLFMIIGVAMISSWVV